MKQEPCECISVYFLGKSKEKSFECSSKSCNEAVTGIWSRDTNNNLKGWGKA